MDSRSAWSAAGGVMLVVSATCAITLLVAAAPAHSPVSVGPAYVFGGIALLGLYLMASPLLRWWPFGGPGSISELLDARIRAAREVRERVIFEPLAGVEAAGEVAGWILRTANLLAERHPAIADRFLLASGNAAAFSGQVLLIQDINAKLAVLTEARTAITG
jgi:hypothetical protein